MNATTTEKLQRIARHGTRYELAMICGDRKILIAYTPRRSRAGISDAVRGRGPAVVAAAGADHIRFAEHADDGATIGRWAVRFTGRTQRDAIIGGELPYVADVVAA